MKTNSTKLTFTVSSIITVIVVIFIDLKSVFDEKESWINTVQVILPEYVFNDDIIKSEAFLVSNTKYDFYLCSLDGRVILSSKASSLCEQSQKRLFFDFIPLFYSSSPVASVNFEFSKKFIYGLFFKYFSIFFIVFFVHWLLFRFLRQNQNLKLMNFLKDLNCHSKLDDFLDNDSKVRSLSSNSDYFDFVNLIFFHLKKVRDHEIEYDRVKKEIDLAQLAAQVAHDIRSPYSVLKSYTKNLSGIPADVKKAIELSVSRIGDILSDLEVGAKKTIQRDLSSETPAQLNSNESISLAPTQESTTPDFTKTIALIALDRIISEKRYQYRDSDQIQIIDQMSLDSTATILVNSKNLGRVISNLLDNAIQAKAPSRVNQITVATSDLPNAKQIEIRISDTGKGISPEVLPKLFQKGATFDKDNGTGLGLFHAKTQVESWGGTIQIQSTQNAGTEVAITLPLVDPPAWLQSKIQFPNDSTILILDDDLSIHEFWKNRLVDCQLLSAQNFNTAKSMMRELPDYFIVDFDLHDSEKSGLDFIKEFGLGAQSILVTSHFEDPAIHEECQNLGIKIFPKPLMAYMKVENEF